MDNQLPYSPEPNYARDAHWVHIFHVTDGDAIIVSISHHFILYFFIVMQILLDEHLRCKSQRTAHDPCQFFLVAGNTRTLSTQAKASPYHYRKTDLFTNPQGLVQCLSTSALW